MKINVKHVARETKSSKLNEKAKKFFQDTKSINCPAFANEKIFFNAKGLQHLFYRCFKFKNQVMEELNAGRRLMI